MEEKIRRRQLSSWLKRPVFNREGRGTAVDGDGAFYRAAGERKEKNDHLLEEEGHTDDGTSYREERVTCGPVVKEMKEKKEVRLEAKLAARPAISFFYFSCLSFFFLYLEYINIYINNSKIINNINVIEIPIKNSLFYG
jgi:hypothetical protein